MTGPGSIAWLRADSLDFPDPDNGLSEPNGLLAAGGDLSPQRLLSAYEQGIFPWYENGQPILWWSPDPRCVLRPDAMRISRSLRKAARPDRLLVSVDQAFEAVLAGCTRADDPESGTWITAAMAAAYVRLHELGHAHSVEVWQDDALVGGLYGVARGRMFFGESMFSRVSDASKVALGHLCGRLQRRRWPLIDCQLPNPHLERLGAEMLPRDEFLARLRKALAEPDDSQAWEEPRGPACLPEKPPLD